MSTAFSEKFFSHFYCTLFFGQFMSRRRFANSAKEKWQRRLIVISHQIRHRSKIYHLLSFILLPNYIIHLFFYFFIEKEQQTDSIKIAQRQQFSQLPFRRLQLCCSFLFIYLWIFVISKNICTRKHTMVGEWCCCCCCSLCYPAPVVELSFRFIKKGFIISLSSFTRDELNIICNGKWWSA